MKETLQQRIDYYEFLIDFISHEVRNPLVAITMFVKLMQDGAYGEISSAQREVLDRILANASRIEHMTEDFLNLSLIEGHQQYLGVEEIDLYQEVVVPVIDSLEKKHLFSPEQKRAFEARWPAGLRVRADRRLMNVVFDNLFFNAVKYGKEGGVIEYGWRREDSAAIIWIRNEGQGVREEDKERIFEKFVRLNDPSIPPRQGTGLGLYNVRKIVEMQGGRIWAESRYGQDFTISFTLPLAGPAGADESRPPATV